MGQRWVGSRDGDESKNGLRDWSRDGSRDGSEMGKWLLVIGNWLSADKGNE
jgi:hypothetical protein